MSTAWRTRAVCGSGPPPPRRRVGRSTADRSRASWPGGPAHSCGFVTLVEERHDPRSLRESRGAQYAGPSGDTVPRARSPFTGRTPAPAGEGANPVETAEQPTEVMERHARQALVLDRYRLVRRLGAGGFGVVWLAHDEQLDRAVALKRIGVVGQDPARAEREALAAARLSHPAIVALYEAGRDDDAVYLVSELVRGRTLDELIAEGALQRPRRAADRRRAVRRARARAQPRRRAPRRQAGQRDRPGRSRPPAWRS